MASLLKWLGDAANSVGNAIGGAADAIIPGDQSSWHRLGQAPTPPSRPVIAPPPSAGSSLLPGMSPSGLSTLPNLVQSPQLPQAPPPSVAGPTPSLIDAINKMANIGPKAVAASAAAPKPQWKPGDGEVTYDGGVQGTLQALGQIPVLGWPVQLGNAANEIADKTARGEKVNPLGEAVRTGVANSPLGAAAQLFGGLANEFNKRAGLGDGTNYDPVFGSTAAISNQVADKGVGQTALDTAMNVIGAGIPEGKAKDLGGPTVKEAVALANNERGSIGIPAKSVPEPKPNIPGALTPHDTPEIVAKRAEVANLAQTHLDNSPERQALRQSVEDTLYKNGGTADASKVVPIAQNRRADIVLGPPASGKSSVLADPLRIQHNSRLIDSDEAKSLLGNVNHASAMHVESDTIANKLLQKSVQDGDNVVLPLVGKNPDKIKAMAEQLHTNGYDVHIHYNHVSPNEAMSRAVTRFNETGRFVDPHYIQGIGLKPQETYDIMKNNEHIKSYQSYNNEVPFGQPAQLLERGVRPGADGAGRPQGIVDAGSTQESAKGKAQSVTPPSDKSSVPFMITRDMKQQLSDLGYSKDNISKLNPTEAWDAINSSRGPAWAGGGNVPNIPSASEVPLPPRGRVKENKFTEGVRTSPDVAPEVQKAVSGQHVERSTAKLGADAKAFVDENGLEEATQKIHDALSAKDGSIDEETVARAIQLIERNGAEGTKVKLAGDEVKSNAFFDHATAIADALSDHLVALGQKVQAASLLRRMTPEHLMYSAVKQLKKADVAMTKEIQTKLNGLMENIRNTPLGSKERSMAIAEFQKEVIKHIPQSKIGNVIGVWKAGMLSGIKTQGGNFESNAMFGAMKKVADLPATMADAGFAGAGRFLDEHGLPNPLGLKGERTKSFTGRGIASGTKEGLQKGWQTMKTGIDERDLAGTSNKYDQYGEINFGNKNVWQKAAQNVLGKPANLVFRAMSAGDQPFHYPTLKNTLYDLGKADGINQGLRGDALKSHMESFVQDPPASAAETALKEASKSTLAHDTLVGVVVPGIKHAIDRAPGVPDSIKAAAKSVIDVLVPFSKIPAGFISRTVDFVPVLGVAKEAIMQIAKKDGFDQRAMSQAIGEGLTGAGVMAIGLRMAGQGQLSGDYPKNNPKEAARWKAEHIIPNAMKIGSTWVSLNYLGSVGLLFGMAKNMHDSHTSGQGNEIGNAMAGLVTGLLNQSFLSGFSNFTDAIKDPQRFMKNFQNSEAGSLIPAWSNDIANMTDKYQRQANGALDTIKSRIPGPAARGSLPAKIDTFGNDLEQGAGSGVDAALNPLRPSIGKDSPMLSELDRLAQAKEAVIPLTTTTLGSGKNTVKLTPEQSTQRQKLVGSQIEALWPQIMNDPGYKELDDAHKHSALQLALTAVQGAVDRTMIAKIDSSKLTSQATGDTAKILDGNPPLPEDYIRRAQGAQDKADGGSGASGSASPAQRYKDALAKFQSDMKANRLSATQAFLTQQSLGRQAITSQYSQQVLDLYGMSTGARDSFLAQNPDQQKLMPQVQALSTQLADHKFSATDKIAKASSGRRGSSRGKISSRIPSPSRSVSTAGIRKLLSGTGKAFKAPKIAHAKVPKKTRRNIA